MYKIITTSTLALTLCAASAMPVHAELLIDPSSKLKDTRTEAGATLSFAGTSYEASSGPANDINRTLITGYAARAVNDMFDGALIAGLSSSSELEPNFLGGGSGFVLGGALRAALPFQVGDATTNAYAQWIYYSEDYGSGAKGSGNELLAGAVANFTLGEVKAYAGLELALLSNIELTFPVRTVFGAFDVTTDVSRSSFIGAHLGARYPLSDKWMLHGDLGLISETTFTVSMLTRF